MHPGTIWSNLLRTSRKLRPREGKHWVKSHQKAVAETKSKEKQGLPWVGERGVQWLRLHASRAGAAGLIPGLGNQDPMSCSMAKRFLKIKKKKQREAERVRHPSKYLDAVVSLCSPLSQFSQVPWEITQEEKLCSLKPQVKRNNLTEEEEK